MASNTKNGVHKDADQHATSDSLRSLLGGGGDDPRKLRALLDPIREACPIVAELLGGMLADKGQPAVDPGTITFFVREGKIRFSANVKSAEKTFIGEVADIVNPFESVELALAFGNVSSKRYTERQSTMTEEQKSAIVY
jgi:hypothetical protein